VPMRRHASNHPARRLQQANERSVSTDGRRLRRHERQRSVPFAAVAEIVETHSFHP
jgi:hypothetical protein